MKNRFIVLTVFALLFTFQSFAQKDVSSKSEKTIANFKKTDPKISKFFNSSYGYAIFPKIGKGGIGVGGATGNGTLYKNNLKTGDARMFQVSVGFQFGGQEYAEVIFFETKEVYDRFVAEKFEFTAQASAVALKSGVSADASYRDGILVFTEANGGLMYEAAVGGQKFKVKMH